MKTDKTKLLQDIKAMKEKLALMEEELNKPEEVEEFKHFPSSGEYYHYYMSNGTLCSNTAYNDDLKVKVFKTRAEAHKAYNKAVALEKIKRRLLELQGDWKPDWTDDEIKYYIQYDHCIKNFIPIYWLDSQQATAFSYIKNEQITLTIIKEMEDELKLIFDLS